MSEEQEKAVSKILTGELQEYESAIKGHPATSTSLDPAVSTGNSVSYSYKDCVINMYCSSPSPYSYPPYTPSSFYPPWPSYPPALYPSTSYCPPGPSYQLPGPLIMIHTALLDPLINRQVPLIMIHFPTQNLNREQLDYSILCSKFIHPRTTAMQQYHAGQ